MRYLLAVAVMLGGCAALEHRAPVADSVPAPVPSPQVPSENPAVASLVNSARADVAAGRLTHAAAALERALRIEPRNPRLWHELARVRLMQGDYGQAESVAARSWSSRPAHELERAATLSACP